MSYIINRTNDGDAIRLFLEKEIVEVMYKKIFTLILSIALIACSTLTIFGDDTVTTATGDTTTATTDTTAAADGTVTTTAENNQTTEAEAAAKAKAEAKAKAAAAKKAKALKYQKGLAAYIRSRNGRISRAKSMTLAGYFIAYGKKYKADPTMLMAMAQRESTFSERAYNSAGYYGIMQTSASLGRHYGFSKSELLQAKNSIKTGAGYLRYNLKVFHYNYYKAVAGYCCGTYAVKSGHYSKSTANARMSTRKAIKRYLEKHNYV